MFSKDILREGLVSSTDEIAKLMAFAETVCVHDCDNASHRCKKRVAGGEKVCRYPRYPASGVMTRVDQSANMYCRETFEILKSLNLATEGIGGGMGNIYETHPRLQPRTYMYPNHPRQTGIATNGHVLAMFRSSTNVQLCDPKFQTSYLIKYIAGLDEKAKVVMTMKDDEPYISEHVRELCNVKISGAARAESNYLKETKANLEVARELGITEMVFFMLKYPFSDCNAIYVYCNDNPLEYRSCTLKGSSKAYQTLRNENGSIQTVSNRIRLPDWRKFSALAQLHLEQVINGMYYADNMTAFNLRPPELLCVKKVEQYLKWFKRHDNKNLVLDAVAVRNAPFVDGLGKCVKVRSRYLRPVRDHIQQLRAQNDRVGLDELEELFQSLLVNVEAGNFGPEETRFLDREEPDTDVVVVFPQARPNRGDRFLVQYILRHGEYECEAQVFEAPDIIGAFVNAGLVTQRQQYQLSDIQPLVRRYVLEELSAMAVPQRAFDRILRGTLELFTRVFIERQQPLLGTPLITDTAIQEKASEKLRELEASRRLNLVNAVLSYNFPGSPSEDDLLNQGPDAPVDFVPRLEEAPNQSAESLTEQRRALELCVNSIDSVFDPMTSIVRSPWLIGPPGSGKTYLMMLTAMYAVCRGLRCCLLALTAQRARALGGEHMHVLFGLPVIDRHVDSPSEIVNIALKTLHDTPQKFAYLKRVQVFFFEEIGLLSAEQLSIVDKILRFVKDNEKPFGGAVIVATGDYRQLTPISGGFVWLSSYLITAVNPLCLKRLVRSGGDQDLQELIETIRLPNLNSQQVARVVAILKRRCEPHFAASFDDVPEHILRVFGKNKAVEDEEKKFLAAKKNDPTAVWMEVAAVDKSRLPTEQEWAPASEHTVSQLDRKCAESKSLVIVQNSVMALTYNNNRRAPNRPIFSQGQLVVVTGWENADAPESLVVVGRLVPPGVVHRAGVIPDNWQHIRVTRRNTPSITLGTRYTSLAMRNQIPLRQHICMTLHRTLGETCEAIATEIGEKSSKFGLWEREQLLVLVSRVRSLDNLTFVGDRQRTWQAIAVLLRQWSLASEHIDARIKAMDRMNAGNDALPRIVAPLPHSLRGLNSEVPYQACGFVYLVVSAADPKQTILNHGACLRADMNHFNGSNGSPRVISFRPWLVCFFICGFSNDDGEHPNNVQDRINVLTDIDNAMRDQLVLLNLERDEGVPQSPYLPWQLAVEHTSRFITDRNRLRGGGGQEPPLLSMQVCIASS